MWPKKSQPRWAQQSPARAEQCVCAEVWSVCSQQFENQFPHWHPHTHTRSWRKELAAVSEHISFSFGTKNEQFTQYAILIVYHFYVAYRIYSINMQSRRWALFRCISTSTGQYSQPQHQPSTSVAPCFHPCGDAEVPCCTKYKISYLSIQHR